MEGMLFCAPDLGKEPSHVTQVFHGQVTPSGDFSFLYLPRGFPCSSLSLPYSWYYHQEQCPGVSTLCRFLLALASSETTFFLSPPLSSLLTASYSLIHSDYSSASQAIPPALGWTEKLLYLYYLFKIFPSSLKEQRKHHLFQEAFPDCSS